MMLWSTILHKFETNNPQMIKESKIKNRLMKFSSWENMEAIFFCGGYTS